MDVKALLEQMRAEGLNVEDAEKLLKDLPHEDLGYAKLDHYRKLRSGFGETMFCQGKPDDYLARIYRKFYDRGGEMLGTKTSGEQYELVRKLVPEVTYDPISRILEMEKEGGMRTGPVAVCTGGMADIPVTEEAAQTAECFRCTVDRIFGVGVTEIHRLLSQRERLMKANCIVAVTGMEGVLGMVVAGLVDCPVVVMPASVGYGTNFHGLSALLTMLNSCANGISAVSIDNGYGAGYLVAQINRSAVK